MKKQFVLFILLVITFSLNAQRISFDVSLVGEFPDSDFFYGDPHYDSAGNISYYSKSDNLRIYYTYDEEGKVIQKDSYILNDSYYEWILFQSVSYKYENGRLIEEKASEISDWYNKLKKPELGNTYVKQIVYDDKNKTQIVTLYPTSADREKRVVEMDTLSIVRYLNENGCVYKSFTREKWTNHREGNEYEYYYMNLYEYDNHSQLIKMGRYYHKTHLPEWTLRHVSEIEYEDNKTVYSFYDASERLKVNITAEDPFGLLNKYKAYLKEQEEIEKQSGAEGDERISFSVFDFKNPSEEAAPLYKHTCTLFYDDSHRIIGREAAVNEWVFVKSCYSYDKHGRTSVIEESLNISKPLNLYYYREKNNIECKLEEISKPFTNKYTAHYSENGCLNFNFRRRTSQQNEYKMKEEKHYCYMAERLLSSVKFKEYEIKGRIWIENRVELKYDSDMKSGEYIQYDTRSVTEDVSGKIKKHNKAKYISGERKVVRKEIPALKILFQLDENQNRINQKKYVYSEELKDWESTYTEE